MGISSLVSVKHPSDFKHRDISSIVLCSLSTCQLLVLCAGGRYGQQNDFKKVWELNDFSLSQTIVLAFEEIFQTFNQATLTSTVERVSVKTIMSGV